jgi:multiple sugar transport system ATP-binding protein
MNTLAGHVVTEGGALVATVPGGQVTLPDPLTAALGSRGIDDVVVGFRPEDLHFVARDGAPAGFDATVSVIESLGYERHVLCRLDDSQPVIVRQPAHEPAPNEGETVHIVASDVHLFEPDSGARVDT